MKNIEIFHWLIVPILVDWVVEPSAFLDVDITIIIEKSKFKTIKLFFNAKMKNEFSHWSIGEKRAKKQLLS
jgi:hypothetical protein